MNELDFILIFITLMGVGIGYRRGAVRVLISIVGIYFTIVVIGYAYRPIGDTLVGSLNRLEIRMRTIDAYNYIYIVLVIALTVAVELSSRSTFEGTRLRTAPWLDKLLGATIGIIYGIFWAGLFLVPGQYSLSQANGAWAGSINGSALLPVVNRIFKDGVLSVAGIFFINGTPELFLNTISRKVSRLFFELASLHHLVF